MFPAHSPCRGILLPLATLAPLDTGGQPPEPKSPRLPPAGAAVLQAFLSESLPEGGINQTKSIWQVPGRGSAAGHDGFAGKIDPRYLRYLIEILYIAEPSERRAEWVEVADSHVHYMASVVRESHQTWALGNALESMGLHHGYHGGTSPYFARVKEIVGWLRRRKIEVHLPDGTVYGHFPCGYGVLGAKDAGWTNDLSMAGAGLVWAYEMTGDEAILADAVAFANYFIKPWRAMALGKNGYWECGAWREKQGCWVIGPAHYAGFESTDLFGDESSWMFSNLTCVDFLMRLHRHRPDSLYVDRCVKAAQWSFRECQFEDGALGMCGRDDKWLGFTAAAVQMVTMVEPYLRPGAERAALIGGAQRAKAYLDRGLRNADINKHGVEWVARTTSIDPLVNVGMTWAFSLLGWRSGQCLPGN